ncbi:MAG: UvrD-helicase domain-containing protein [Bacillota bacterium]
MGMQGLMSGAHRVITSDTILDEVERHLRVVAGPGAGKTHWLVSHIRNVLAKSQRLTSVSRVVCISYTNVAADEIRTRLRDAANRVEVTTIHSYLYRFVVKPYIWLAKDHEGICPVEFRLLQGHDELRPSYKKTETWFSKVRTKRNAYLSTAIEQLGDTLVRHMIWRVVGQDCQLALRRGASVDVGGKKNISFPAEQLYEYKRLYWRDGEIDHDDVLYFSFVLLRDYPYLRQILSTKFPFIFVDEFQDTSPIQTAILKWLAESGSVVGVIGDPAQSIFGFQGASPEDFVTFSLPGMMDLIIEGNRRSTERIVRYLNHLRADLVQHSVRGEEGSPVTVIVGGKSADAVDWARSNGLLCDPYAILAWTNSEVAAIRSNTGCTDTDIWNDFRACDRDREQFLHRIVGAAELAVHHRYDEAFRTLSRLFPVGKPLRDPLKGLIRTKSESRAITLAILEYLVTQYSALVGESCYELYSTGLPKILGQFQLGLKGLSTTGRCGHFMRQTSLGDLMNGLIMSEEERIVRTIHKAKGAEFTSVIVCLKSEDTMRYLLERGQSEGHRLYYVAVSRARDFLLVHTPTLTADGRAALERMGVQVVDLA